MINRATEQIIPGEFRGGLNTSRNVFLLAPGESPSCENVAFEFDGSISKRLGVSSMNSVALERTGGFGLFDYGVLVGGIDASTIYLLHAEDKSDASEYLWTTQTDGTVVFDANSAHFNSSFFLNASGVISTLYSRISYVQPTADTQYVLGKTGVYHWENAVKVNVTADFICKSAAIFLTETALTPTGSVWMYLETDSSNFPSGVLVSAHASQGLPVTKLSKVPHTWWGVDFPDSFLVEAGTYWLRINLEGQDGSADWIGLGAHSSSTIRTLFRNTGGTWAGLASSAGTLVQLSEKPTTQFDLFSSVTNQGAVDCWVKFNDTASGLGKNFPLGRFDNFLHVEPRRVGWASNISFYHTLSAGYPGRGLTLVIYENNTILLLCSANFYISDVSTFHHVGFVKYGSNIQFLLDGSASQVIAFTGDYSIQGCADITVGGAHTSGNFSLIDWPFHGWIDEFRVSNTARFVSGGSVPALYPLPATPYASTIIQNRRLIAASGTGLYYSENLGRTWVVAQTNRAAAINHFSFVKNYIIDTNDAYDAPQYWAGSAGTYFLPISTAAPACKYSLAHQGYFILLNQRDNRRGFYYVDWNDMFDHAFSNFSFPSNVNDEITGYFVLGRFLYVSTKLKLFRVEFTGTNPDWSYLEVRSWGFVPNTMKKINVKGMGEVVIGLDYAKRLRIFDGSNDQVISDRIEYDNGQTTFFMSNINNEHLEDCWAENDTDKQIYRLHVPYGTSNVISHEVVFDYRIGAFYVNTNRVFGTGVMVQDTLGGLHMVVADYSGFVHIVDSGNTDNGVPVDDKYISPFFFRSSPALVVKAAQISLFFAVSSSGTLFYEDRQDFSSLWSLRREFDMNTVEAIQTSQTIDLPTTNNAYQFKLSSSANTANPWTLNIVDYSFSGLGVGLP